MGFCTDLLARVRSRFSAPSAHARGRGRSRAPEEFCGSVEPRLYFPRGAATACVIEGRVAPRCNGRKAYTVYLLKIRQVKNNYCSGLPKQLEVKLQYSYRNYNHVIIIILYVKWVESVGVSKGVWFVLLFFLKSWQLWSWLY